MKPHRSAIPERRVFPRTENECIVSEMVKGLMDRLKVSLISLFSGLSFLVSGQSLFVDCAVQDSNQTTCVLQSSKDSCSHGLNSYDIFARQAVSRIGKHLGKGHLPSSHLLCRSHSLERIFLKLSCADSEKPSALATCWQFECRAALNPRAPSLVS